MEGCRQVVFIIIEKRVHTSVYGNVLLLSPIFSNSSTRICVGCERLHTSLFSKSVTDSNRRGAVDEVRPGVRYSTAGLFLASPLAGTLHECRNGQISSQNRGNGSLVERRKHRVLH